MKREGFSLGEKVDPISGLDFSTSEKVSLISRFGFSTAEKVNPVSGLGFSTAKRGHSAIQEGEIVAIRGIDRPVWEIFAARKAFGVPFSPMP